MITVVVLAPSDVCSNGAVRLVNGTVANEGRVELCFHGHWGTVCANMWTNREAAVVCGALGYGTTGLYNNTLQLSAGTHFKKCFLSSCFQGSLAVKGAFFGEGTGPILVDAIQCQGDESMLLECTSEEDVGQHGCNHSQDAGVICSGKNRMTCLQWKLQ